ncbi:MAG: reverse transcriptase domain-containing protein [Crocosphaera sp.]|nr:reverse transcriptase domain-containing protein [Crocosphaera sp.]
MVNQKKWSLVVMNTAKASLNTQKAWNTINWAKVQRKVFKLQKRIFQAVQSGQKAKARKLQQLLLKSHYAKLLAVRQVTQDNQGKNVSVDSQVVILNYQPIALANSLNIKGYKAKSLKKVRRFNPEKYLLSCLTQEKTKRYRGLLTLRDRAMQILVKLALEPYWEAQFARESYGFRPGKSIHDAIDTIFQGITRIPKYVLNGKIANCFDKINHDYLLSKLDCPKTLKTTIKHWLRAGLMDNGVSQETQILSPLLVNIALEGMIKDVTHSFPNDVTLEGTKEESFQPIIIRYVDDFVVLHQHKPVIRQCQQLMSQWLQKIGLQLQPETTRICHTLYDLEIDGKQERPGFDFLGFNIKQYPTGKHHGQKNGFGECLKYRTLIKPSQQSIQAHYQAIVKVVNHYKHAPQQELINKLNPIIKRWSDYYGTVSSSQIFSKLDKMIVSKLRAWIKTRTGATGKKQMSLYFRDGINGQWTFQTKQGHYLVTHRKVGLKRHRYHA